MYGWYWAADTLAGAAVHLAHPLAVRALSLKADATEPTCPGSGKAHWLPNWLPKTMRSKTPLNSRDGGI